MVLLAADDEAGAVDRPGLDRVGVAAFLVRPEAGNFLVGEGEFRPLTVLEDLALLAVLDRSADFVEALDGVRERSLLLDATELVGDFLVGDGLEAGMVTASPLGFDGSLALN